MKFYSLGDQTIYSAVKAIKRPEEVLNVRKPGCSAFLIHKDYYRGKSISKWG